MEKMKQGTVYNHFIPVHFWLKLKALPDCFALRNLVLSLIERWSQEILCQEQSRQSALKWTRKIPRRRSLPGKKPFPRWDFFWENVCEVTSSVTGYSVFSGAVGWCWKGDTHQEGRTGGWVPGPRGLSVFYWAPAVGLMVVHTRDLGVSKADIHAALKELKVHQGRDLLSLELQGRELWVVTGFVQALLNLRRGPWAGRLTSV